MASAEMIACEKRFRYNPRTTSMFVAESAHEGPFSFTDDVRQWDISDTYERRYWVQSHVFDIRFAVVSSQEILAVFVSTSAEIREQLRGIIRIIVRPGCSEAVLESCMCQTTEQITRANSWGKSTMTDSMFRGFRMSLEPLNEYSPLRLVDYTSDEWKTLFLPTGYKSIVLGSVLERESDIMASEAEYMLRVQARDQRFPIYEFNRDRAGLVRQHAMNKLVDDIEDEVSTDRLAAKSMLRRVSPFGDDILDVVVSTAIDDSKDRVKSISKSDFVEGFRMGDTPFMICADTDVYIDFGGSSLFNRVAIISWYRPVFDHTGAIMPRERRYIDPRYPRYPGYSDYLARPI